MKTIQSSSFKYEGLYPFPHETTEHLELVEKNLLRCEEQVEKLPDLIWDAVEIALLPADIPFPLIQVTASERKAGSRRAPRVDLRFEAFDAAFRNHVDRWLNQTVLTMAKGGMAKPGTQPYRYLDELLKELIPGKWRPGFGKITPGALRQRIRNFRRRHRDWKDLDASVERLAVSAGWVVPYL